VSGPFQSEREAREAVRHIIGPDIYAASIVQGNRALVKQAVTGARVELGAWDRQILDWLADYEIATVAVLAGLITRAADAVPPALAPTIAEALADGLRLREKRLAEPCADCDTAKGDPQRRELGAGLCERHCGDHDQAALYRLAAQSLGLEVTP
jgi:hypothetical protein